VAFCSSGIRKASWESGTDWSPRVKVSSASH